MALGDLGGLTSLTERWWSQISVDEGGSDYGLRDGAGDENRTRMTNLEGICAPARADSDAPSGLTSSHREAPSSTLA